MTEKRFLNFILGEGIILTALGLCLLMIPKLTSLTFGLIICISFIIYGIYKSINAFLTRNYTEHFMLNIALGILLTALGVFLLFVPMFNLAIITALIGDYFLLESISSMSFAIQTRKTLYFWWINLIVAILQFLLGLIIILGLPTTAFWIVGMFIGINFLFAGMTLLSMFISNKYIYNI
jgi:uncharacterized membrane protein HdeD (DUF308 family)